MYKVFVYYAVSGELDTIHGIPDMTIDISNLAEDKEELKRIIARC